MRIESLRLERYGAFESRSVDLSGPGLIVIYGPNEAGKSTCLSAIGDFFYTIPHNSPLGVFGYDAMRIGATLSTAGGKRLVLQRRKGRGRTLVDDAGIGHEQAGLGGGPVPEFAAPVDLQCVQQQSEQDHANGFRQ